MANDEYISTILDGLNEQQTDAVTCTDGPVLIIAGAGTGKTTVIARRIAYLIGKGLAQPNEILALTFTDKAANEMEERVDQLLPFGTFDTYIATFHSFGERILRENALDLRLPTDFRVLTKPQQVLFFQQNLFRFTLKHYRPLSTPTKFIQALITLFSRAKDENISPNDYRKFVRSLSKPAVKENDWDPIEIEKQKELAECYQQYEAFKDQAGVLDFGDLIVKCLDLFMQHPAILKKYQQQFKYILVDEFQDTNFVQNELVKVLAREHGNICVVGDDDQSIYRFRGAAISNILQFQKSYTKAKQVVLTTNYRSTQPILDASYKLIRNNDPDRLEAQNNIDKKLRSAKSATGFPIQTLFSGTLSDEVDTVVSEIERLTSDRIKLPHNRAKHKSQQPDFDAPLTYSDIAILVRANNHAEPFLRSLAAKGIPYKFTGTTGLYDQPEIKQLLSFLTVVTNVYDNLHLFNIAASPLYDFPIEGIMRLTDLAKRKSKSLYWAIDHAEQFAELIELTSEQLTAAKKLKQDLLLYAELAKKQNAGTVLFQFLKDKKILENLQAHETAESATAIANIAKFFDKIEEFQKLTNNPSAQSFIDYLQVMREAGDDPGTSAIEIEYDGVNVMTVHAAKGLEFKAVFLINAVADRFPSRDRSEAIPLPDGLIKETLPQGDFHIQEERRLFYVAMTRATDLLYITWAKDYGGKRLKKSSPFVAEALGIDNLPLAMLQTTTKKLVKQLDLFWTPTPQATSPEPPLSLLLDDEKLLQLNQAQVEEYLTCPMRYKFSSILRIPLARHHLFVYGAAMHAAIQEFYKYKMQQKEISLPQLLAAFEKNWIDEGFLSEQHAKDRFNQGKKVLEKFWERERGGATPTWIEKPFKAIVNGNIKLVGRMDRVDISGDVVHILDFKTTENMTQEKADKRAKDSMQLAVYALAFYKMFNKLPDQLSLYFVEDGLFGSYKPTMATLQKAEEQVVTAALGIRAGDFAPRPEYLACQYCAYNTICPKALLQ